jgi:hypothetical protein
MRYNTRAYTKDATRDTKYVFCCTHSSSRIVAIYTVQVLDDKQLNGRILINRK